MAHIRQSKTNSGLGFRVKVLKAFQVDLFSFGSGARLSNFLRKEGRPYRGTSLMRDCPLLGCSGFGVRVSAFGFRCSGFGVRVSGFGFQDSGFRLRDPGFGFGFWIFGFGGTRARAVAT